jgi:hypothetical protein
MKTTLDGRHSTEHAWGEGKISAEITVQKERWRTQNPEVEAPLQPAEAEEALSVNPPPRSEARAAETLTAETFFEPVLMAPVSFDALVNLGVSVRGWLATSREVTGNIVTLGAEKWASFKTAIARVFFKDHFSVAAKINVGFNAAAVRGVLGIKVVKSGQAIVVMPGAVAMGLLPLLRAAYPGSDIFVVGADPAQDEKILRMKEQMSGLKLETVVESVRDGSALRAAIAKRTKYGALMQVSGLYTAADTVLADTLKTQVPDFILANNATLQNLMRYTNHFIQGLMAEFQAAASRERLA